jgi:hypothetical protein
MHLGVLKARACRSTGLSAETEVEGNDVRMLAHVP